MLSPLFAYSDSREAWMLRGVGRWVGPVLVPRDSASPPPAAPATPEVFQPRRRRFERREQREARRARARDA